MDIRRQFGSSVRKLREKRGWSQEELSFEADLHRTYISGIERGVRNPTITIIKKIADALKVSASKLLESVK